MERYEDILKAALTSAPWEARSVNGAQHDHVDWFAAGAEGFPFAVVRVSDEDPIRKDADRQGDWESFEFTGQSATPAGFREANRWHRATQPPFDAKSPTMLSLKSLMEAARKNRVRQAAIGPKPAPRIPADGACAETRDSRGLHALAVLRDQARKTSPQIAETPEKPLKGGTARNEDVGAAGAMAGAFSVAAEGVPSGETAAHTRKAAVDNDPSVMPIGQNSGLAALARLRDVARTVSAPSDISAERTSPAAANRLIDDRTPNIVVGRGGISDRANLAPGKQLVVERRIIVMGVNDPFAAHLLRGCLLASAQEKRALPGLDGVFSEKDFEACSGSVYLSHALCPAGRDSADADASSAVEADLVASSSLGAFGSSFAAEHSAKALGAPIANSFAVLDFIGSPQIGDRLPAAFELALEKAHCTVVLAEPAREDIWRPLTKLLDAAVGDPAPADTPHRTLTFFTVDNRVLLRSRPQRRFLRSWWKWFGNGSRWGFYELAAKLDRAMGILGFNLHQQTYDLGLVSIIASQIRDGGTIASADDIADALADRFPDRELLQTMVDSAMELLVSKDSKNQGGRLFLSSGSFFNLVEQNASPSTSNLAATAMRSSPSIQTLFHLEGTRLEVRFSTMFACLAARWFLRDASSSLLQVADALHEFSKRVPAGGWGRIVLQTVLLAEQRGQAFAGRVILDRLYSRTSESEKQRILMEISLGVFLDAAGDPPLVWREGFFNGSVTVKQSRMLKEAHDAGWLRSENLLTMRRITDDLCRHARMRGEAEDVKVLKSCHWMDLLLRAIEADTTLQLFIQIADEVDNHGEEARVRALGRYDCLIWACLFGVELPCPTFRHDALNPGPLELVGRAAEHELAEEGPAYAECSRFAWIYGIGLLPCKRTVWKRMLATALRIIERASCDGETETLEHRIGAYQVLSAYALQRDRDGAAENGCADGLSPSSRTLMRMANDLKTFVDRKDGKNALYLTMALTAFGPIAPTQAKEAFFRRCALGSLTTLSQLMAALFSSNLADGTAIEKREKPSSSKADVDPSAPRDPKRVAELHRRWKSCIATLSDSLAKSR